MRGYGVLEIHYKKSALTIGEKSEKIYYNAEGASREELEFRSKAAST